MSSGQGESGRSTTDIQGGGESIRAEHMSGVDSMLADWLSLKDLDQSECLFHPQVFTELNRRFGPMSMLTI